VALPLPHPLYDPIARRWAWQLPSGSIEMGYYWLLLCAAVGVLLGAVVGGRWIGKRPSRTDETSGDDSAVETRALVLLSLWAVTGLVWVGAWFTWANWP
jgi:hypothetical protein